MIISHSREYIFVHVHKCGGESVEIACSPALASGDLLIGRRHATTASRAIAFAASIKPLRSIWRTSKVAFGIRDKGASVQNIISQVKSGLNKHSTASEIRDFVGVSAFDKYFKFTIVRRPEDRIYSLYKWSAKLAKNEINKTKEFSHKLKKEMSWPEIAGQFREIIEYKAEGKENFLIAPPKEFSEGAMSYWTVRAALVCDGFDHFTDIFLASDEAMAKRTLTEMICDPQSGNILVDNVVALHNLEEEWPLIATRIGAPSSLPKVNSSSVSGLDAMSAEASARIREFYRDDIERFGL